MYRIYKIDGKPVLNSFELIKSDVFKPLVILDNLSDFLTFAEVHCASLPKVYLNKNKTRQQAEYLKKTNQYDVNGFWFSLLKNKSLPAAQSSRECFDKFCKEFFGFSRLSKENSRKKDILTEEIDCLEIDEKLSYICKSASKEGQKDFAPTAVRFLAICEIADADARNYSFKISSKRTDSLVNISYLPDNTSVLKLTARPEPYKYYYHDDDGLAQGEKISTIKLKAVKGKNIFDKLKVSLYSEKTGELLHTYSIEIGGYRHLNSAGGKIIKFLPTVSVGNDICVYREAYTDPVYYIKDGNGTSVIKLTNASNASSVSAAQDGRGVLFIINGQPYSQSLSFKNNPYLTNSKDIVEGKLVKDGFVLLHSSGTFFSNLKEFHLKKTASIDKAGRLPMPAVENEKGAASEVVFSGNGKLTAVKLESGNNSYNGKVIIKSK